MIADRAIATIAGVAALVLLLAAGIQTHRLALRDADLALVREGRAQDRAAAAAAAASGIAAARAEESRRHAALQEIADAANLDAARARDDAAAAARAAGGLRQRAAQLAAGCGATAGDPAAATGSAPAAGAGLLLADLLGRADDRAGGLAAYADQARAAGIACERAYDSLRQP